MPRQRVTDEELITPPTGMKTRAKKTESRMRAFTHPSRCAKSHHTRFGSLRTDGATAPGTDEQNASKEQRQVYQRAAAPPRKSRQCQVQKTAILNPNDRSVGCPGVCRCGSRLMSLPIRSVRLKKSGNQPDRDAEPALAAGPGIALALWTWCQAVAPTGTHSNLIGAAASDPCPFAPDTQFGGSFMSAAAMIRTCVVHGVVLLLAGRALAQTDATNPPAPPAAAVVSASQSPPKVAAAGARRILPEPGFLTNGIEFMNDKFGDGGEPKSGFYPEFSNMITGPGGFGRSRLSSIHVRPASSIRCVRGGVVALVQDEAGAGRSSRGLPTIA